MLSPPYSLTPNVIANLMTYRLEKEISQCLYKKTDDHYAKPVPFF